MAIYSKKLTATEVAEHTAEYRGIRPLGVRVLCLSSVNAKSARTILYATIGGTTFSSAVEVPCSRDPRADPSDSPNSDWT
jgi:hypothetical protein